MSFRTIVLCFPLCGFFHGYATFVIPEVTLEAYDPQGFRASIPAVDGIQLFGFHGNKNKAINQVESGELENDSRSPNNNMWTYYNQNLTLKIGDTINYWIYIQHDKLGYRKDNQEWKVTELLKIDKGACESSISQVAGKTLICKNKLIFEENFTQAPINNNKWLIDQYIPIYTGPDYEFVSYQHQSNVSYISDEKLYIKPKYANDIKELTGELDLRSGCTRDIKEACYYKQEAFLILPPVTSARLVSKFKFKYGRIEVKAKLPAGDWIYPQIYLEQVSDPTRKLWIAYARGNDKLVGNDKLDIGANLLFGGPVLSNDEPDRSQLLRTKQSTTRWTSQVHTYSVDWNKERISLKVDGTEYGEVDAKTLNEIRFSDNDMVSLVLGVGVGGVNDFPDDYRSGTTLKPWSNRHQKQVRQFFNAKSNWINSWKVKTDNRALQIDSVKIYAL